MRIKILMKAGPVAPGKDPQVEMLEINASYHIVGRKGADTVLDDSRCSKQHCVLYESYDGHLRVKDLGSTNGTYVNEKRVTECDLNTHDRIRIGRHELQILDFITASVAKDQEPLAAASPEEPPDAYEETTIREISVPPVEKHAPKEKPAREPVSAREKPAAAAKEKPQPVTAKEKAVPYKPSPPPDRDEEIAEALRAGQPSNPDVLTDWPHKFFSGPKSLQQEFIDFVDAHGTQTRILLSELRKERESSYSQTPDSQSDPKPSKKQQR